jgi:hypothetical protein
MSLTSLLTTASEVPAGEPAIHPYLVGAASLAILLAMMIALLIFGKGRDHS